MEVDLREIGISNWKRATMDNLALSADFNNNLNILGISIEHFFFDNNICVELYIFFMPIVKNINNDVY